MKQILVMMAAVMLVGQSVVADEKLIADPIVEKAVLLSLEKPEGELTEADLENVTALVLRRTKITDAGLKEVLAKCRVSPTLTWSAPKSPTQVSRRWPSCEISPTLTWSGTKITDAGLKEVVKLQKVKGLTLDLTQITDGLGIWLS